MSKLSHSKAIARKRRNHHGHVKCYSRKEMKELMPRFGGQKLLNFKDRVEGSIEVDKNPVTIFMQFDKNGEICDCTRVGNIFSFLQGRYPSEVNWEERFINAFSK